MSTALLCNISPDVMDFEAQIIDLIHLPNGKIGAVLESTYFYPTGGGQEHDVGMIGPALVTDVIQKDGRIVHVLDQNLSLGQFKASIDRDRRLRHMQHHSAQHLLSYCFLQLMDADTISSNINGYTPSTLDIPQMDLSPFEINRVEEKTNAIIFEDRPIKSFFATPDELSGLPLRRRPVVTENIRIVEIEKLDCTPCGGTHCRRTGQIGLLKIIKTEKPNRDRLRIFFTAGFQSMEYLREYHHIVNTLSLQFNTNPREILLNVQRLKDELFTTQEKLQLILQEKLKEEAYCLIKSAISLDGLRVIISHYADKPVEQIKTIAEEIRKQPDTVSMLANFDGQKITLIVACGDATGISAQKLLQAALSEIGGRGGGNAGLAQGGGPIPVEMFQNIHAILWKIIHSILEK